jgi:hypothetical protein
MTRHLEARQLGASPPIARVAPDGRGTAPRSEDLRVAVPNSATAKQIGHRQDAGPEIVPNYPERLGPPAWEAAPGDLP